METKKELYAVVVVVVVVLIVFILKFKTNLPKNKTIGILIFALLF